MTTTVTTPVTTPIHPTPEARQVHLSHLATTRRAPLVPRSAEPRDRVRATAFTPMAPYAKTVQTQQTRHGHPNHTVPFHEA